MRRTKTIRASEDDLLRAAQWLRAYEAAPDEDASWALRVAEALEAGRQKAERPLRALARQLRGNLAPGAEWGGDVLEGDVVAEVRVRVQRALAPGEATRYREAALEKLRAEPWLVHRCVCDTKRRGFISHYPSRCQGRVVAVVVWRPSYYEKMGQAFRFVCSRHRERHGIRGEVVLAVVDLPERLLAPVRAEAKRLQEEHERKWRAEEEARAKARRGEDA